MNVNNFMLLVGTNFQNKTHLWSTQAMFILAESELVFNVVWVSFTFHHFAPALYSFRSMQQPGDVWHLHHLRFDLSFHKVKSRAGLHEIYTMYVFWDEAVIPGDN